MFSDLSDNPDVGGNSSAHGSVTPPPQALNFGSAGSGDMGLPYMTTESLLRKIQALLKAAADKIRDDERSLNFEKGEGQFIIIIIIYSNGRGFFFPRVRDVDDVCSNSVFFCIPRA